MAFFDGDFFKGNFFKNPFFGEPFFQEPFFDDTTIAHGLTGGTTSATTIVIVTSRTMTGDQPKASSFIVTHDGVDNPVISGAYLGKDLTVTVTIAITAGQSVRLSFAGETENNIGILSHEPIVNNEV